MKFAFVRRGDLESAFVNATKLLASSLATVLLVVGCGDNGDGEDISEEEVDTAGSYQVEWLAKERQITLDEARLRLSWQTQGSKLHVQLEEQVPSGAFGGFWVDPDDGDRLKVGIVESIADGESVEQRVALLARDLGLSDVVDIVPVAKSQDELEAIAMQLAAEMESISPNANEVMALIDKNTVRISVSPETSDADIDRIEAIADELGISGIEIDRTAEPASRNSCGWWQGWRGCAPGRAGQGLYTWESNRFVGTCTMAFAVTRGATRARLTAGHCFSGAPNWYIRTAGQAWVSLGTTSLSRYSSTMDAGLIRITNPSSGNFSRYLVKSNNSDHPILFSSPCTVGNTVCYSGGKSGEQCGKVAGCNATAWFYRGGTSERSDGMIKFHASSQGGDSGSPIFSGNGAYGILIGGDGTNSYGYSMSKVLNALGATLYTGTGSDV